MLTAEWRPIGGRKPSGTEGTKNAPRVLDGQNAKRRMLKKMIPQFQELISFFTVARTAPVPAISERKRRMIFSAMPA